MAEPKKDQLKTIPGLRVVAKTGGFRRAGIAWSAEATEVPVRQFSKEQLAQLRAEPQLVVTDIEIPAAE